MKGLNLNSAIFTLFFIFGNFFFVNTNSAWGEDFCVSSEAELNIALATAASNGENDIIKVREGLYIGSFIYASTETFGVSIEGGYTSGCATRMVDATNTVLDAQGRGPVLVLSVNGIANDFIVDGITIQNGDVTGNRGGGLYVDTFGRINIFNNIVKNNKCSNAGGGFSLYNITAANITNNLIYDNNSNSVGGGGYIYGNGIVTMNNNEIYDNFSDSAGGGLYITNLEINLINNVIRNNTANIHGGGGIAIDTFSDISVTNNTILNNACNGNGAGLYILGGETKLINNLFTNNIASANGGGVYFERGNSSTLINNTVCSNIANNGGGIWGSFNSQGKIYNNIILNNSASGGKDLYIVNDPDGDYIPSTFKLFRNDFEQSNAGTYVQIPFAIHPSNLNNLDPLFVDSENDDYHLTANSPLIDKGENSAPELPATDKDGKPRIINGDNDNVSYVDIGAYEFGSPRGDLDGDGDVDGDDLKIFAESYGTYLGQ
jgi:hypothetical protein